MLCCRANFGEMFCNVLYHLGVDYSKAVYYDEPNTSWFSRWPPCPDNCTTGKFKIVKRHFQTSVSGVPGVVQRSCLDLFPYNYSFSK